MNIPVRKLEVPKLFTTMRRYSRKHLIVDSTAGFIVGIVALPLCIALAIASGVPPEKGLITGVIGGLLISTLGGSRVQIGGPAGAFVVIVYGIVQQYGIDGLMIATMMAGVILVIMGLIGFGSIIKFIPHPVVVGFTSGIAVIIFTTQIKDFFGLRMRDVPVEFIDKWEAFARHFYSINPYALGISVATILILIIWPRFIRRFPASLIALVLMTAVVYFFQLPVETIGSRFGSIPSVFPTPTLPEISWETVRAMIGPATTIAILCAIESLLSAVVADGMIGGKHRSNIELIAQGAANIASPLFGGIPATGAIARTATNIRNGARTPVAGIVHALTLLGFMLLLAPLAENIPLACLAAILVVVAYNMSEWRSIVSILNSPKSDVAVLLTTLTLTVLIDLTVAIEVGMVLAAFLFMQRMSSVSEVAMIWSDGEEGDPLAILDESDRKSGIEVFEVSGPLFFGAAYKFKEAMDIIERSPKVRIVKMNMVPAIDDTGVHALLEVHKQCKKRGTLLLLSGIRAQPLTVINKSKALTIIGENNVFLSFDGAITAARKHILERQSRMNQKS